MTYPALNQRHVIITGCSTGIGASAAHHLRERGWTVFPTARKDQDLQTLRAQGFTPVSLDTADPDSVARAAAQLLDLTRGNPGALVNNAGFGQAGAVEDISRAAIDYQFQVNVIGMQDLTNRLLPAMRAHRAGRIVNISSVVGRISLPYLGVYSASKFAMEALSDALRVELTRTGIAVSLIEPGPITTAFRANSAAKAEAELNLHHGAHASFYREEISRRKAPQLEPRAFTLAPEAVVKKIIHALESPRPKRRYKVTLPAYFGAFASRFLPHALLDALLSRQIKPEPPSP
ncbi:MAG TPA: SDR family NAD(P)-dependent oxidoreductase [Kiritimatiellia bacterium]|nr:SDR family NAD(P)-dependent oxidoreductase [Kiritimatiellia bacterium]